MPAGFETKLLGIAAKKIRLTATLTLMLVMRTSGAGGEGFLEIINYGFEGLGKTAKRLVGFTAAVNAGICLERELETAETGIGIGGIFFFNV